VVAETGPGHDDRHEAWRSRGLWVHESAATQMVIGLMIMGLGTFLALGRFGLVDVAGMWRHIWPVVFIGLGVSTLLTPRSDGRRHGAGLLLFGTWLLLNELHIWRARDSWPLFLVALGIKIAWNARAVSSQRLE